jgi:hypothetical protein
MLKYLNLVTLLRRIFNIETYYLMEVGIMVQDKKPVLALAMIVADKPFIAADKLDTILAETAKETGRECKLMGIKFATRFSSLPPCLRWLLSSDQRLALAHRDAMEKST